MYGTVVKIFKNDEGNYVCQLWGGSTKHPDLVYHMENFEMAFWVDPSDDEQVRSQIFQWLCWIASQQNFPPHAEAIVDYAMKNWPVWKENS